jgi:hypothetical protein
MRTLLFTLIIIFISIPSNSQDIIIKKDGISMKVKVKKIGTDEIEYLKHEKLDGSIYIIMKNDVAVIYFEDGSTEIMNTNLNSEKAISLNETKDILIEYFGNYTYSANSNEKKGYKVTFEGDYIRLSEMNKSGEKVKETNLFDFSKVYRFGKIDKRKEDVAFLNIWVSIMKNKKKDKWEEYKLVIRVKGHNNAELLIDALKHYKQLLLEKNGFINKFKK